MNDDGSEPAVVQYEVLYSPPGRFSHIKVGVADSVGEGETAAQALTRIRKTVRDRIRQDLKAWGTLEAWNGDDDDGAGKKKTRPAKAGLPVLGPIPHEGA